jgi:hypothetical protein
MPRVPYILMKNFPLPKPPAEGPEDAEDEEA